MWIPLPCQNFILWWWNSHRSDFSNLGLPSCLRFSSLPLMILYLSTTLAPSNADTNKITKSVVTYSRFHTENQWMLQRCFMSCVYQIVQECFQHVFSFCYWQTWQIIFDTNHNFVNFVCKCIFFNLWKNKPPAVEHSFHMKKKLLLFGKWFVTENISYNK